jgi:hypothetical protein
MRLRGSYEVGYLAENLSSTIATIPESAGTPLVPKLVGVTIMSTRVVGIEATEPAASYTVEPAV